MAKKEGGEEMNVAFFSVGALWLVVGLVTHQAVFTILSVVWFAISCSGDERKEGKR